MKKFKIMLNENDRLPEGPQSRFETIVAGAINSAKNLVRNSVDIIDVVPESTEVAPQVIDITDRQRQAEREQNRLEGMAAFLLSPVGTASLIKQRDEN